MGGHCLPVDPSYLSWQVRRSLGTNFRFVELANDINDHMPDYVVKRVIAALNREKKAVNGSTIALLGLAYKKNTGDVRESPSKPIARQLQQLGATVKAVDPHIEDQGALPGVQRAKTQAEALDCRRVMPDAPNVERL